VGVRIDGRPAPVTFVSPTQINAQAPTLTLSGPVKVEVVLNPGRGNEVRGEVNGVVVQRYTPALFTFDGRNLAAVHTNGDLVGDPNVLKLGGTVRPARPSDIVSLFGTGFGFSEPVWQAGELPSGLPRLNTPVTVTVGGLVLRADDIQYAGLAPGSISGLYQFNIRLPATVSDGDIPVSIGVAGSQTQSGTTLRVQR
jgi:uncharacterized protein (TIGR03437 family)